MKKILCFLPFLVSLCYAAGDTITTGNLKLLQPSLTQIDKNRNAGDKLNSDLQIIDSSFTTLQTQVNTVAGSTAGFINAGSANAGVLFASMTISGNAGSLIQNNVGTIAISTMSDLNVSSPTITGSWNFSSSSQTFKSIVVSSLNVTGSQVTSTNGFVGGGSTFTTLALINGLLIGGLNTNGSIQASSLTLTGLIQSTGIIVNSSDDSGKILFQRGSRRIVEWIGGSDPVLNFDGSTNGGNITVNGNGTPNAIFRNDGGVTVGGTATGSLFYVQGGSITVRGAGSGLSVGATIFFVAPGGNVTIGDNSSYSAFAVYGGSISVIPAGGVSASIGIAGAEVLTQKSIIFSTQLAPGVAGGGSSGQSTTTITLEATGDVFLSTNPNDNGAAFVNNVGTFNITSAWAYQTIRSTVPGLVSTFTVIITTVIAGTGTDQNIIWTGMDSSSWTVNSQTVFSTDSHKPSITSTINSQSTVYMLQMTDMTVLGVAPRGAWGMKLRGWWAP